MAFEREITSANHAPHGAEGNANHVHQIAPVCEVLGRHAVHSTCTVEEHMCVPELGSEHASRSYKHPGRALALYIRSVNHPTIPEAFACSTLTGCWPHAGCVHNCALSTRFPEHATAGYCFVNKQPLGLRAKVSSPGRQLGEVISVVPWHRGLPALRGGRSRGGGSRCLGNGRSAVQAQPRRLSTILGELRAGTRSLREPG